MTKSRLSPSRTLVTNFGTAISVDPVAHEVRYPYDETIWVLDVAASDEWISCGLSNGDVNIYDRERLDINRTYPQLHGKGCAMSDLTTSGSNLVATSSANGQCCIIDVRQPTPALTFSLPRREEALSVSLGYDGVMAAVGSNKSLVHFHDIRQNGVLLGTYQDAHTDEVTRVRFQSAQSPLLVSASEDGLACIFDTSKPSEEAALKSVLNVQTPLRKVGFFGPSLEGIYCLTGSETLSVWHHESAQRICDFGVDVRDKLSTLVEEFTVNYLVDCRWDVARQELSLVAGNHDGDACMYKVDAGALSLSHFLQGGHRGDVRSWCPLPNSSIFMTVGEDARMCEWNRLGCATTAGGAGGVPRVPRTHCGGPLRRPKKKANVTPY